MSNGQERTWWDKFGTPLSILVGIVLTVCGWLYNKKSEREHDLRSIRNSYISNAYKDISFFSTLVRFNLVTKNDFIKFEKAFKDIQLYGSLEENDTLRNLITSMRTPNRTIDYDRLLNLLRNDLRKEYGLKKIGGNTFWMMDTAIYKLGKSE